MKPVLLTPAFSALMGLIREAESEGNPAHVAPKSMVGQLS